MPDRVEAEPVAPIEPSDQQGDRLGDGAGRSTGGADPQTMAGACVELRGLTKHYPGVIAVDGIDLTVAPGELVSLLGPSGSGKTTTLMMLAGFEVPSGGSIVVDGRSITSVPPHKRNIGMVFQNYALFPHMTVAANIGYPLELRRVRQGEVRRRVERVLDTVRLPAVDYAARYPRQLSGGQQQRVALARALVYEPRILLMDEPMGALDKNLRAELQEELRNLHRQLGVTILYVTHDQEEAITLSDRIAVFRDGAIVQIDTPQAVYSRPRNRFVAQFLGDANILPVHRSAGRWLFADQSPAPLDAGGIGRADQAEHRLLMIRPENTALCDPGAGHVGGQVADVTYLGSASRVVVATPLGRIVSRAAAAGAPAAGSTVGLTWAADQMVVLDDEQPPGSPPAAATMEDR